MDKRDQPIEHALDAVQLAKGEAVKHADYERALQLYDVAERLRAILKQTPEDR